MPPTAALAAALVVWAQTAGAKRLDTTNPAQRHAVISAADPRAGSSSLHLGRQLVPAFGQGPQLTPQGATSALANVSNQIHSLGNATEGSGNAANVIEIAGKIAAAAGRVASELPANSEDAAGLMEAVKTAKGAVAASDALLGAAAFVESKEWEAVTTTAAVPPSFEGTTLGQFPPSSPRPAPPAAPPPPGPPRLEPAGEDGNTVAEVDGPLVAIIVMLNVLFLLLVVLPVGYALHTYPGKASTWLRLKTTHSNVRSSPYYLLLTTCIDSCVLTTHYSPLTTYDIRRTTHDA